MKSITPENYQKMQYLKKCNLLREANQTWKQIKKLESEGVDMTIERKYHKRIQDQIKMMEGTQ